MDVFEIERNPAELGRLRHAIADALRSERVAVDLTADVMLVASELASNAVESAASDSIKIGLHVRLSSDRQDVVISVANAGTWLSRDVETFVLPDAAQARGRGLAIARSLSEHFSVCTVRGRTVAVAHLARAGYPVGSESM